MPKITDFSHSFDYWNPFTNGISRAWFFHTWGQGTRKFDYFVGWGGVRFMGLAFRYNIGVDFIGFR